MGYGIEIDDAGVLASVATGVNVLQSDLESGLGGLRDRSFDYVILSQTLQAMRHTEQIVGEMLRVGRAGDRHLSELRLLGAPAAGAYAVACRCRRRCRTSGTTRPTSTCARVARLRCASAPTSGIRMSRTRGAATEVVSCRVLPNLLGSLAVYRFDRGARP